MENSIKFSITVLKEERIVVGSDFTDQQKQEFIESLEAKHGGEVHLIETRVSLNPLNNQSLKTARRDALPLGRGRDSDGETHGKRDNGKVREGEEGAGASVKTELI